MAGLVDGGYSPSAGVVNVLDSDFEVARDLRIPVVTEIPFAMVSEDAHRTNLQRIAESKAVVVTEFQVGPGNMKNLEAADAALREGKPVFVVMVEKDLLKRDFVGGKAKLFIEDLISRGAVPVSGGQELVAKLGERLGK